MLMNPTPSGASRLPAEQEWELAVRKLMADVEIYVLNMLPYTERIREVNGLDAMVAATAEGEYVGKSTMTKERMQMITVMLDAFNVWANTPVIPDTQFTPIVILSYREP